jgi:hypothetical protein
MTHQISPYLPEQEEFIKKTLVLLREELNLFRMGLQYHSYSSMILSSVLVVGDLERVIERVQKEPNFKVICDDHEYYVCDFGTDVGTVVLSYIVEKKTLTVNINL